MNFKVLILTTLIFAGCSGGDNDSGGNFVPNIQLECTSAQVSDCSQNTKTVFVGLIESLSLDCDDTLNGLNASQRQQLFTVSGTATSTRSGIYLIATVSRWFNSTGGRQDVLNPGTYQVCAFVDTNGNGVIDTNEPTAHSQLSTGGGGTHYLRSWTPAFN